MLNRTLTGTYLDRILENTEREVEARRRRMSFETLIERAQTLPPALSLFDALQRRAVGVIAEIKRASPSKGLIAGEIVAREVAAEYLRGGCAAISVLTDGEFFQGSLGDLEEVVVAAHGDPDPRPVLRKDFVIDAYQVVEARAHGADAVLLIVAALDDRALRDLYTAARELGMDALVEVHNESELKRALRIKPTIIGINNRDLRTFEVDLATTERLAPDVPAGIAIVGESGVYRREDVARLQNAGVNAVLVGESLMRREDRAHAVQELTL